MSPSKPESWIRLPAYEGERCRIRPFRPDDAEAFFDMVRRPSVPQYMNWHAHKTLQESREYLDTVCASYPTEVTAPWAIAELTADRCCGFIGLSQVNVDHRRADLALGLHPDYQGRGIAKEACRYIFAHAARVGYVRVQAVVEAENTASLRLMESLAMHEKVRLGRYIVGKAGVVDAFQYAYFCEPMAAE